MSDLGKVLPRIQPANEIALPIVPTGTIRITLSGKSLLVYSSSPACLLSSSCRCGAASCLAKAELSRIPPYAREIILHGSGDRVAQRPLAFYDAVAKAMAREQRP